MAFRFFGKHPLSNFADIPVTYRGITFPTSEHAFHWAKVVGTNPEIARSIVVASTPAEAKRLGNLRVPGKPIRSDWDTYRLIAMKEIITAKAEQSAVVARVLESTGHRQIIEDSPYDDFWGRGRNHNGQNWLGKLWEQVRYERRMPAAHHSNLY